MAAQIQVSQISESEYVIEKNRTCLIEDNIIYVIASGEQTDELAIQQKQVCEILGKQINGDLFYLIDVNSCGKNSPGARAIWHQLSEDKKTAGVAVFGIHPVAKVIASFVIGISRKKNMRFFKTKEESLSWINQIKKNSFLAN